MKKRFIKVKHPESELVLLSVEVDPEPGGGFQVIGCRVTEIMKPQHFSALLEKNGFDEAEVRMEIEQALEAGDERIL